MKRSLLPKIKVLSVHHQSWVCKEVLRPFSFHFTCFTSHCIWKWLPSALPVTITSGPSAPMPDKNRNNGIPWQWCPQSPWPQLTSKTDQQNIRSSPGKSKLIFLSFTLLLRLLVPFMCTQDGNPQWPQDWYLSSAIFSPPLVTKVT